MSNREILFQSTPTHKQDVLSLHVYLYNFKEIIIIILNELTWLVLISFIRIFLGSGHWNVSRSVVEPIVRVSAGVVHVHVSAWLAAVGVDEPVANPAVTALITAEIWQPCVAPYLIICLSGFGLAVTQSVNMLRRSTLCSMCVTWFSKSLLINVSSF